MKILIRTTWNGQYCFCNHADFDQVRQALLRTQMQPVPYSSLKAYGELNLVGMRRA